MRSVLLGSAVATLVACSDGTRAANQPDASPGGYILPPVIDAGPVDAWVQAHRTFPCGTLSGAVQASLRCDHVFPDFDWDGEPGSAFLYLAPTVSPGATGADAAVSDGVQTGLLFQVFTGSSMKPLALTCATLPALPPEVRAGFSGGLDRWVAACNSATDALAGSSFDLVITSVGPLASNIDGTSMLDASATTFPWDAAHEEVIANQFHGSLRATLVAPSAPPIYVDMSF